MPAPLRVVRSRSPARGRGLRALCAGTLLALIGTSEAAVGRGAALEVGRLTLHRCDTGAPWCGSLERPLDPSGTVPGAVPIYFEYYPHSASGPAAGTLVATEGGPGYPATGSRAAYLALFGPLRAVRDVLIMDNRGTGRSGALDCEPLQTASALSEANVGACGRSLGRAAPLYSTALAADDLAALLEALSIGRIDLYGDSYGTYFAQVFALRHPERVRSLLLDGAYPLDGPDYAWYPHYAIATREKFNLACKRSPDCRVIPGSSTEHIVPALERLRKRPFAATVQYGDGHTMRFTADASTLAIVMFGGSPAYLTVRELDAAARAFQDGDEPPLLRLMAETLGSVDSRDPTHSPRQFSAGLAAAVFCQDPPQIFDMSLALPERAAARDREIARRGREAPDTFAPFTFDEYRGMPLDYAFIDECVQWPARSAGSPAVPRVLTDGRYPDVPVLVLSGELDNMTSVADGAAAAERFPRARHVVIANSFHVNALPHARSDCGAMLARRFIERLETGDESCAAAVPAVRLVPRFARHVAELVPAHAVAGNEAGERELRAVSAALSTCADVLARAGGGGGGSGVGLRGGTFRVRQTPGGYRVSLREVRWTEDLVVSGQIDASRRSGFVHASLELEGAPDPRGTLVLEWREGASAPRVTVGGTLAGRAVIADAPAP